MKCKCGEEMEHISIEVRTEGLADNEYAYLYRCGCGYLYDENNDIWHGPVERQCECKEWQFWKDQMVESPDHKNVVGLDDLCKYCPLCGGQIGSE